MSTDQESTTTDAVTKRLGGLRNWNVGVGLAHLAQAVLLLVIASDFAIPLVAQVQTGPPGSPLTVSTTFFEVRFAWVIAAFLLLAAADHLLMASPWLRPWYERNLLAGRNTARWVEYSVSASLMVVLIGMLTGITDLYAVMGLFAANAAMILFGLTYRAYPAMGRSALARLHYWTALIGAVLFLPGIYMAAFEGIIIFAVVGSLLTLASMALFFTNILVHAKAPD